MSKRAFALAFFAALQVGLSTAHAQYPFGKNKVIYRGRDWRVLQTEHVDIYHYAPDSTLILYLAPLVESTYREYSETFRVDFERRVPFVFYATHYDFQQTNILPVLISEYTGGFTDLIKGRIAVPANGSYSSLRHVVRHEMVHAFMLEKLQRSMHERGKFTYSQPPLWFVEGMAEYYADSPQDAQGEMFVRDALLSGRLLGLSEIWKIEGSYMMYKHGEALINYISTNFGHDAVVRILDSWWTASEFSQVLKNTIGLDLFELDEGFQKYVRRRYYPAILDRGFPSDSGVRLTPNHTFHSRPVVSQDFAGNRTEYSLTARDGRVVIAEGRGNARDGWTENVLIGGGQSGSLESIPAFRSKLEIHGDTLVFVSKSNDRDVVYLYSVSKRRKIAAFSMEGLSLISSPTLSGDGTKMVFSAIEERGRMDLFLVHLPSGRIERLTEDGFSEEDPDYHPREDVILFTSDRQAGDQRGRTHIYKMDLASREITPIEGGPCADYNPEWAPDGKSFLFTSDREGAPNIYQNKGDVIVRQTDVLTGANTPSFLPDGKGFVASVYENAEFHVYEFPLRDGPPGLMRPNPPDSLVVPWSRRDAADEDFVTKPYETRFSVDFVGAGVAIDPGAGDVGNGGQLELTDVLGNHQINLVFGTTTEDFSSFWRNFNAAVSYLNLSHRVNYSVSLFHLNTSALDRVVGKEEKRVGAAFAVSYPLNKFERIEASTIARYIEQRDFISINPRNSVTGSVFGTYVRDNTLWTFGGPLTGWRYYVTGGPTIDFRGHGFDNTLLQLDIRRYLKLSSRVVFAMRYITRNSWGGDEQVFYLGGPWTLRGYDYQEFFGKTTHLFNTELRFPLLDGLSIVLPFGPIDLPMFRGALFFDAGQATRNDFDLFDTPWLGSLGTGMELNLGYAPVIRVNFTWRTDFHAISSDTGFELFLGYNY